MDIVKVEQQGELPRYSFLSIGWGILSGDHQTGPDRTILITWFHHSDIDIESERLRALGENRFQLWSLNRLANLRLYRFVEQRGLQLRM